GILREPDEDLDRGEREEPERQHGHDRLAPDLRRERAAAEPRKHPAPERVDDGREDQARDEGQQRGRRAQEEELEEREMKADRGPRAEDEQQHPILPAGRGHEIERWRHAPRIIAHGPRRRPSVPRVLGGRHPDGVNGRNPAPSGTPDGETYAAGERGRNFGSAISELTSSNTTSTGMPTRRRSMGQSTTFERSRPPSASSTTTTAYGTASANPGW